MWKKSRQNEVVAWINVNKDSRNYFGLKLESERKSRQNEGVL